MGRTYKRREFLIDASFALWSSVLLKACAISPTTTAAGPSPADGSSMPPAASDFKVAQQRVLSRH